ncbi:MAG: hypothetical protein LBI18_05800 [Planctomycetaceae bacterium]|jgi:capsular polysaccharide biosynthesis protein|nr:hypothetical protein [Planctomycetaceae bacterium]
MTQENHLLEDNPKFHNFFHTLCRRVKQENSNNSPTPKITPCRKKKIILGVILLVILFWFLYCLLFPTYTATAYLQILSNKPYFIFDENQVVHHERFVETQRDIIQSPLILEKVLETPEVAQIPIIKKQKDKIAWLARKLKVQQHHKSEIITISITLSSPENTTQIVNSVVSTFFDHYLTLLQDSNIKLVTLLNLQLNRHKATAKSLQEEIRNGLEHAAKQGKRINSSGNSADEPLLRELYLQEAKLDTLQTELITLQKTTDTNLAPKILEIQTALDLHTRLVKQLQNKYQEQLVERSSAVAELADVEVLQTQLRRVDSIIDQLETRVTVLEIERFAPYQIELRRKASRPIAPDPWWQRLSW